MRGDHSVVHMDAGGTQRSDWPVRVLANDENMKIDPYSDRLHACRDKWQLTATVLRVRITSQNSLYPGEHLTLAYYAKCATPLGLMVVSNIHRNPTDKDRLLLKH